MGTSGNDVLVGTNGRDVILALGGDDTVNGLEGNDVICGGGGDDTLIGDRGNDTIVGGAGNDRLEGNRGRDDLYGGQGADALFGGKDPDRLWGNSGADVLAGNNGADELRGGKYHDTIDGGEKVDQIWGGGGNDFCDYLDEVQSGCEDGSVLTTAATGPNVACNQNDIANHFAAQVGQQTQSTVAQVRSELVGLINETRSFCGLPDLTEHADANSYAQGYTDVLRDAKDIWLSQGSPPGNPWFQHGTAFHQILGQEGFVVAGENLAFNSGTADVTAIHVALVNSVSHFCNVVSPDYDVVGVGALTYDGGQTNFGSSNGMIVTEHFAGDSTPASSGQQPSVCS